MDWNSCPHLKLLISSVSQKLHRTATRVNWSPKAIEPFQEDYPCSDNTPPSFQRTRCSTQLWFSGCAVAFSISRPLLISHLEDAWQTKQLPVYELIRFITFWQIDRICNEFIMLPRGRGWAILQGGVDYPDFHASRTFKYRIAKSPYLLTQDKAF